MAGVAVLRPVARVAEPHLRIHEIGRQILIGHRTRQLRLDARALGRQVHRRQGRAGAGRERRGALENLALQRLREAARSLAELAAEQLHDRLRKRNLGGRILHLGALEPGGDHEKRHVAHRLGGRSHLDDVAEHSVDIRIGGGHFRPAGRVDAERARLLAQVRVLARRACRARTPRRRRRAYHSRTPRTAGAPAPSRPRSCAAGPDRCRNRAARGATPRRSSRGSAAR